MPTNDIHITAPALELSFSWPLSKNTVLSIRVAGDIPSPDDVADLPALLDLAKTKIQREVAKAAEGREITPDYTVE